MPKLWRYFTAGCMNRFDNFMPAIERFTVEARDTHFVGGRLMINRRTFGDDKPHIVLGAAFVILQHCVVGYAVWRKLPSHWCHGNAIF